MASLFAITTPTSNVMLDLNRHGQASFTVTNTSGRPVRGRARLAPQNPQSASWLAISGPPERDFPAGSTQQFTVAISVPPKAPLGTYPFRLDMIGVENPDEDYTQGPGVTFQVSTVPQTKFPWWIIAVVVLILLLVGGVIAALFLTRKASVPDVTGMSLAEAQSEIKNKGFILGDTNLEESGVVPVGMITHTDPPAGDQASPGAKINLFVSSGPGKVTITLTPTPTFNAATETFTPTVHPSITISPTLPPTLTFTPTATPTNTEAPSNVIARYPLASDANDASGKNGPINLQNAPFQDGGVYCNGIYNNCLVQTPQITGFDYNSFTISVKFKAAEVARMPVFVGGRSYRWIGYYLLENGHVGLLYNNNNILDCGKTYNAGTTYTGTLSYDGTTAKLYLNRSLACSQAFALQNGGDTDISLSNFSNGTSFKGVVSDLIVYNKVIAPGLLIVPINPGTIGVLKDFLAPIADYPLTENGNDAGGKYGPMEINNASFAGGGIYCGGDCLVRTPPLTDLNYNSFTIAIRFNPAEVRRNPVFVGGSSYRWIGYYLLENGHVALLYNNSNILDCGQSYTAGNWYDGMVSYDGTTAKLYFNGTLACSQNFALQNGGDKDISLTNFSNAAVFKGYVNNLKVSNAVLTP